MTQRCDWSSNEAVPDSLMRGGLAAGRVMMSVEFLVITSPEAYAPARTRQWCLRSLGSSHQPESQTGRNPKASSLFFCPHPSPVWSLLPTQGDGALVKRQEIADSCAVEINSVVKDLINPWGFATAEMFDYRSDFLQGY
ncbi:hypothetical protein NHX12_027754 [Muraenolepis orangiensis]|uniref:Uncharacterized protein n=1 Tax=Muraenolepis orangiensis TaxID=630683 RepID=A0A9Q0IPJ3_9TELE|nr:hypothetical protein NHX12_027754 [Muraenolepis orangiensis]